jgi:hypothetical protein
MEHQVEYIRTYSWPSGRLLTNYRKTHHSNLWCKHRFSGKIHKRSPNSTIECCMPFYLDKIFHASSLTYLTLRFTAIYYLSIWIWFSIAVFCLWHETHNARKFSSESSKLSIQRTLWSISNSQHKDIFHSSNVMVSEINFCINIRSCMATNMWTNLVNFPRQASPK